jgi:hypothetical protein
MSEKVNDDYPGKSQPMSDSQLKAKAIAQYEEKQKQESVTVHDFPTEIVELPSKGLPYDKSNPLSSGKIEMKYMSAKEEDILTNQSYIKQGVVLDKLFKALIVSKIEYNDLLVCDKNAIMIAARVLGYGKEYNIKAVNPNTGDEIEHSVDLTQLKEREIDWSIHSQGKNTFDMELPYSKRKVTLKLLTQRDQKQIDAEQKGLDKLKKKAGATTLLKHMIVALDGDDNKQGIRNFIDTHLLAIDSRAIRQYYKSITPDIMMSVEIPDGESGDTFRSQVNPGLDFFWPDAQI